MSKRFSYLLLLLSAVLASCSHQDEPLPVNPAEPSEESSLLVYAVASNNLESALHDDLQEMLQGYAACRAKNASVWVYYLTNSEMPALYHIVENRGEDAAEKPYIFAAVKHYDRNVFSTDPKRISEVLDDYEARCDAKVKGLVFWSHGSGWTPDFSSHQVIRRSFGWDSYQGKADHCDIVELAEAIPTGVFSYIWFDACYMGGIETVYQLRRKADYIISYPTEIWAPGMPYDLTLPWLLRDQPALIPAASALADYYHAQPRWNQVTISVVKTSELENLAKEAEKSITGRQPNSAKLQKYSRSGFGPFFDFGQYTSEMGHSLGDRWDADAFQSALDKTVIFKDCSDTDFNDRPIDRANFSGLSVHYFADTLEEASEYYKTLDWFKDVYTTVPEF